MHNFMDKISGEQVIRRCPLFWRVYLQFVGIRNDNTSIKNIFYKAVNECPYAKVLVQICNSYLINRINKLSLLCLETIFYKVKTEFLS